ncbi:hypothetical protein [Chroococcus sp. FPU101]|uniref:hypothetical protein n=1 Tax=Chroococcus sp. FPU101 TaxID=1974212 RepID=UPI001AAABF74|nr:hypothetical protein [Chroococcus sp. FPU101]GFE70260.1 hypothetical protein CFPU101_28700 [Chroococcus sp. FPU101]
MVWLFSLSAECGTTQSDAEKFAQYFAQISFVLSNGMRSQCHANLFQDLEENWWCRVTPDQISEVGINTPETAYIMTEIGIVLYHYL